MWEYEDMMVFKTFDDMLKDAENKIHGVATVLEDFDHKITINTKDEVAELLKKYNDLKLYVTALEQENIRLKEETADHSLIKTVLTKVIQILQNLVMNM